MILIASLICASIGYSYWTANLSIGGTIIAKGTTNLPVEIPPIGQDSNGVNRYTSSALFTFLGVQIYKVVDEKYEGNTITTYIKHVYKQTFDTSTVGAEISLTIPNNTSDIFTDGKIELTEYNDNNARFNDVKCNLSSNTIASGETTKATVTGTLKGRNTVADNTYYYFRISFNLNGETRYFYYNIIFQPLS